MERIGLFSEFGAHAANAAKSQVQVAKIIKDIKKKTYRSLIRDHNQVLKQNRTSANMLSTTMAANSLGDRFRNCLLAHPIFENHELRCAVKHSDATQTKHDQNYDFK